MSDNSLKIAFDYNKPDEAVLLIYKTSISGFSLYGGEPSVTVERVISGKKAIALYSELSGKSIEQIEELASR